MLISLPLNLQSVYIITITIIIIIITIRASNKENIS